MTEKITILKTNRPKDTLIPTELIRTDTVLVKGIEQYCQKNKLNTIYIDNCIAIFDDYLLIASYNEEVTEDSEG